MHEENSRPASPVFGRGLCQTVKDAVGYIHTILKRSVWPWCRIAQLEHEAYAGGYFLGKAIIRLREASGEIEALKRQLALAKAVVIRPSNPLDIN